MPSIGVFIVQISETAIPDFVGVCFCLLPLFSGFLVTLDNSYASTGILFNIITSTIPQGQPTLLPVYVNWLVNILSGLFFV